MNRLSCFLLPALFFCGCGGPNIPEPAEVDEVIDGIAENMEFSSPVTVSVPTIQKTEWVKRDGQRDLLRITASYADDKVISDGLAFTYRDHSGHPVTPGGVTSIDANTVEVDTFFPGQDRIMVQIRGVAKADGFGKGYNVKSDYSKEVAVDIPSYEFAAPKLEVRHNDKHHLIVEWSGVDKDQLRDALLAVNGRKVTPFGLEEFARGSWTSDHPHPFGNYFVGLSVASTSGIMKKGRSTYTIGDKDPKVVAWVKDGVLHWSPSPVADPYGYQIEVKDRKPGEEIEKSVTSVKLSKLDNPANQPVRVVATTDYGKVNSTWCPVK